MKSHISKRKTVVLLSLITVIALVFGMLTGCKKEENKPTADKYDPLNNTFQNSVEDWKAMDGATVQAVDKFLVIRGMNASAQKKWTLPDSKDLWVDFDYKPDGAAVSLKIEVNIDGKKVQMTDALPVNADFGILNYQIPFSMHYTQSEYGGKEAELTVKANGATAENGVQISAVRTYARSIAGTVDSENNPLVNTFEDDLEDWYIGGHFSSMDYGYQLRAAIEPYYGKVKIDGSQLATRVFTPNINTSMSKYFALPENDSTVQYEMNVKVEASDKGTMVMLLCIVDGKVLKMTDGWFYIHSREISTLSCAVPLGGKMAQVILMQRDSNLNSGHGEFLFVQRFEVVPYREDPYNNRFVIDLEDWTDLGAGTDKEISVEEGYARLANGASMEKTITFPELADSWRQSIRLYFSTVGQLDVKLTLTVDGVSKTLYSETCNDKALSEVMLNEFDFDYPEQLGGKQGKFTLTVSGGNSDSLMLLKTFRITKKWMTNPYDNQFFDDMEDWYNISHTGWDNNRASYDPSWTRIQVDFSQAGSGDERGQTVFGKTYTMLDSEAVQISFTMEGSAKNPTGYAGKFRLDMIVDGETYCLMENVKIIAGLPVTPHSVNLDELDSLKGVDYAGKEVTMRFQFDQVEADNEMLAFFDAFVTEIHK